MQPSAPRADVGVIVGRFQVHELHDGHRDLIDTVASRHNKLVILLGSTPGVLVTRTSPLDFQTRRAMINEAYPDITVLPIKDMPDDADWSRAVDAQVASVVEIGSVILYGSRDGFIPYYSGKHHCTELEATFEVSGTAIRNSLSHTVRASRDFRHGVVYAAFNRHPVAFPTVDIALLQWEQGALGSIGCRNVALIRQANDPAGLWRFPGGFVDPQDCSLEHAACRELGEELNSHPGVMQMRYVGSRTQSSWRYRNEVDDVMTTLFAVDHVGGAPKPGDDAVAFEWFPLPLEPDFLVPEHQPLAAMLNAYLKKEQR